MEIFKDIKGYEGIYQVSNLGRIKSLARISYNSKKLKEKILKGSIGSSGYLVVWLVKNGKRENKPIHQLVAVSFLGHVSCGFELVVNHIDFDKTNNNVDNLEIVTARENSNKKHLKNSSKFVGVSWHKATKKWMSRIEVNGKRKHLGVFTDELEASNAYQLELSKLNN